MRNGKVSVSVKDLKSIENISLQLLLGEKGFLGDTPNALAFNENGDNLFFANGLDNALAVIKPGLLSSKEGKGKSTVVYSNRRLSTWN